MGPIQVWKGDDDPFLNSVSLKMFNDGNSKLCWQKSNTKRSINNEATDQVQISVRNGDELGCFRPAWIDMEEDRCFVLP